MEKFFKNKKVAIVYDRVNKWGGAERVLLALHKIFPNAPLYTSVYNSQKAAWAKVFPKVYTSFLQNIPFAKNWHEGLGWLMPFVFESFDFSKYDLVISVTSEAAKGIITKPGTYHFCYMLTPTRYLWSHHKTYFKNPLLRFFSTPVVSSLKYWDRIASQRPDKIIAISSEVKNRIKKYYGLDSEIIFPPTIISRKGLDKSKRTYYLYVGRLVSYKNVDTLVKVFNSLGKKLIIVGEGHQFSSLKKKAKGNIRFLGNVNEKELISHYKEAKALIMPQIEDFGLVSVEAQSFGTPVIALNNGGARDTVINGKTGLLYNGKSRDLSKAIAKFGKMSLNHRYIRENAKKFGFEKFKRQLQRSLIRSYIGRGRGNKALAKVQE